MDVARKRDVAKGNIARQRIVSREIDTCVYRPRGERHEVREPATYPADGPAVLSHHCRALQGVASQVQSHPTYVECPINTCTGGENRRSSTVVCITCRMPKCKIANSEDLTVVACEPAASSGFGRGVAHGVGTGSVVARWCCQRWV
jgi:hypothetical protein